MHSITKGDLAESIVITEALKRSYQVSVPFSSNSKYDLIIDRCGVLEKVQIKLVTPVNGKLALPVKTMSYDSTKGSNNRSKMTRYVAGDFDWIVCVDSTTFIPYFVPAIEAIGFATFSLRIDPPKNGQTSNVRTADKYKDW